VELVPCAVVTTIGLLFGGGITWWLSKRYYIREAQKLKDIEKLNILTLRALEKGGYVKINRDKDGKPRGLEISLAGKITSSLTASGKLTVEKKGEPESRES